MGTEKVKFSNVISTVKFKNGILKITQLRLLALILMVGFVAVSVWVGLFHGQEMPFIVQVGIWSTILFLIWGVYDILTTTVTFRYDAQIGLLQLKARRRGFNLNVSGAPKDRLSLSVRRQLTGGSHKDRYMVQMNYEDDKCVIPFELTGGFSSKEKANQELEEWAKKLKLG